MTFHVGTQVFHANALDTKSKDVLLLIGQLSKRIVPECSIPLGLRRMEAPYDYLGSLVIKVDGE